MKSILTRLLILLLILTVLPILPACDAGGGGGADTSAPETDTPTESLEGPTEEPTETPTEALTEAPVEETPTEEDTEPETTPEPRYDLTLIEDHATDYAIIYPERSSQYTIGTATGLRDALVRYYRLPSSSLRSRSDRSKDEVVDNDNREILIGMTNRKESQAVAATLEPNSYVITSVGNKLVILGTDEYRTAEAVNRFLADFSERSGSTLIFSAESYVQEVIPMGQVELAENATIRIMSWNLQCPDLDEHDLLTAMQNGINYYNADIIGLQECNGNAHLGVVDCVRHLYAVATTYHEGTNTYDYTPILYKAERFDLIESGVEWLDGRYTGTNTKCLSWAVFADKQNGGTRFAVVNFHGAVASNKYTGMENMTKDELTAQATAWKIDNIHQIHRKIAALEKAYGEALPVLVTGDYNTSFGAEPYRLMENYGYLDAEFNAVTSAMSGTKSTHSMGQKPAVGKSIDHVFFSPDRGITVYVHAFGMRQSDLDATDHLPLFVDFAIEP